MAEYEDNFESCIPIEFLDVLLDLGNEISFDPTSSQESEEYFCNILKTLDDDQNNLQDRLRSIVIKDFLCLDSRPDWIQNPNWQFANGKPITFVGQLNLPPQKTGLHDDASFFVFWDQNTGETKTIIQVA